MNGLKDFPRVEHNLKTTKGRKLKMRTSLTSSVEEALKADRRATMRGLADIFGASYGTVYRNLTEELHMSKVKYIIFIKFNLIN